MMWEGANGVCEKYQILCGKCQNEGSGFKSLGSFAFFPFDRTSDRSKMLARRRHPYGKKILRSAAAVKIKSRPSLFLRRSPMDQPRDFDGFTAIAVTRMGIEAMSERNMKSALIIL